MAKFGNFVRKNDLELTEEEKQMFENFFKKSLFEFKKDFEKVFVNQNITEECFTTQSDFKMYYFNFLTDKPLNGRNWKKERIFSFTGISFAIRKSIGYLGLRDENGSFVKDYDNAPKFQYGLSIIVHGRKIPYKSKNQRPIVLKNHFQYGTEIDDFEFVDIFQDLEWTIRGIK